MNPSTQILFSCALSFGVPLVLALRELLVLRRRGGGSWPSGGVPRGPATPPTLSWRPSLPPLNPSHFPPDLTPPDAWRPVRAREPV